MRSASACPDAQNLRTVATTKILCTGGGTVTADELREALAELGLNQTQAAERLDVSLRTVQNWCAGVHEVPGPVVVLIRTWLRHPELLQEADDG